MNRGRSVLDALDPHWPEVDAEIGDVALDELAERARVGGDEPGAHVDLHHA
jgi:hypothetical protein